MAGLLYTYQAGFNHGYYMQSAAPEIMTTIVEQTRQSQHEYILGMHDGANELKQEHQQVRLDELTRLREGGNDLSKDRE